MGMIKAAKQKRKALERRNSIETERRMERKVLHGNILSPAALAQAIVERDAIGLAAALATAPPIAVDSSIPIPEGTMAGSVHVQTDV